MIYLYIYMYMYMHTIYMYIYIHTHARPRRPQSVFNSECFGEGVFVDSAIQTTNSQRDIQIERELELKDAKCKDIRFDLGFKSWDIHAVVGFSWGFKVWRSRVVGPQGSESSVSFKFRVCSIHQLVAQWLPVLVPRLPVFLP